MYQICPVVLSMQKIIEHLKNAVGKTIESSLEMQGSALFSHTHGCVSCHEVLGATEASKAFTHACL